MFWRKWVTTDVDLVERLSRFKAAGYTADLKIPPTGLAIRVYTESSYLNDAILDVFARGDATPSMRVGYFTNPALFRAVSGWAGTIEDGLSLVNPSSRALVAFGPARRGYLVTTIRGMCHIEVDPKGFVPVHGAVLENGLAIVGPSGAGKSTLGLRFALEEKIAMIADDWSCWQVGTEIRAVRVADPMVISESVFSATRHLLPADVIELVERGLRKDSKVKIGHALFPVVADSVVVRRVFLPTKMVDQDFLPQVLQSNYHIPFIFPWSRRKQSRRFIESSTSSVPFLEQAERVETFWASVCQRVPVTALDTNGPIESTLKAIRKHYTICL
jgi:hypothetical protein